MQGHDTHHPVLSIELALFRKFLPGGAWLWVAAAALKYHGEASCGVPAGSLLQQPLALQAPLAMELFSLKGLH